MKNNIEVGDIFAHVWVDGDWPGNKPPAGVHYIAVRMPGDRMMYLYYHRWPDSFGSVTMRAAGAAYWRLKNLVKL